MATLEAEKHDRIVADIKGQIGDGLADVDRSYDDLVIVALLLRAKAIADERERAPTRPDGTAPELLRRSRGPVRVDRDSGENVVARGAPEAGPCGGLEDLDRQLAAIPPATAFGALPSAGTLARCAGFLRARHALNRGYVERIARQTDLPVSTLPYLADGVEGPDDLDRLAGALLAEPEALS